MGLQSAPSRGKVTRGDKNCLRVHVTQIPSAYDPRDRPSHQGRRLEDVVDVRWILARTAELPIGPKLVDECVEQPEQGVRWSGPSRHRPTQQEVDEVVAGDTNPSIPFLAFEEETELPVRGLCENVIDHRRIGHEVGIEVGIVMNAQPQP